MQTTNVIGYISRLVENTNHLRGDFRYGHERSTGRVTVQLADDLRLTSRFQPIVTAREHASIGHEALVCGATAAQDLGPDAIFARFPDAAALLDADRLCRLVHTLNFVAQGAAGFLFLNVHPRLLSTVTADHGRVFEEMLHIVGLPTHRVVLELPADGSVDESRLSEAVRNYRRRGYRIALSQLGPHASSLGHAHALWPDFLKLKRGLIGVAARDPLTRRILKSTLGVLHAFMGIEIVAEGIATIEEARVAESVGADLLQGHYYARPGAALRARVHRPQTPFQPEAWAAERLQH